MVINTTKRTLWMWLAEHIVELIGNNKVVGIMIKKPD